MTDYIKGAVVSLTTLSGNALCWATSTDLGAVATGVTALALAVSGAIWVLGNKILLLWQRYLATKLRADIARDNALGEGLQRQLAELKAQLKESEKRAARLAGKTNRRARTNTRKIDALAKTVASRPRVLVVEDNPDAGSLVSRLVQAAGFETAVARTSAEAIALLAEKVPTAVVLDLCLADGSGEDVLREIRAKAMPVKVVIATGLDECDPQYSRCVGSLMPDAVLTKPVDADELLRVIRDPTAPRPHLSDFDSATLSGSGIIPTYKG